jgi:O-antigen/teichoic acid export membrane protein
VLVARVLSKPTYGALGVVQNTVNLFGTVAGFGLGVAATKYVSEYRHLDPARVGRIVGFALLVSCGTGAVVSLAMFTLSDCLAGRVLAAPALAPELRISTIFLFMGTLYGLQQGILSGLEAFKTVAAINLWSGLASAPLQVLGALLGGLRGSIWALALASLLNFVLAQVALHRCLAADRIRINFTDCAREARLVAGFGLSLVVTSLVVACANWTATAYVVNQNAGYSEMATLNASNNWFGVIVFFAATVQQGIFPALSETAGTGNRTDTIRIVRTALAVTLAIATPIAAVGIMASPVIMRLYGRDFASAWPVMAMTIFTAWVYCFHGFLNQLLLALGRSKWYFATHLVWASVFVTLLYARIRSGAAGFAASRAVSYVVIVALTGFVIWTGMRRRKSHSGRAPFAT